MSQRKPLPSPVGSCRMIGDRWLVRGNLQVTKLGEIIIIVLKIIIVEIIIIE